MNTLICVAPRRGMMSVLLLTTFLCAQSSTDKQIAKEHALGQKMAAKGIPNFGQVSPMLLRGAQPSPEGIKTLKEKGVDIVVDMRGSASRKEESLVEASGMKYVSIPSHCPFPEDKPWAKFLSVIQDNPDKKIFVHCRLGDDRTGMAVASYRMAVQGWAADEALKEMKVFGFTGVHPIICPGLDHYEQSFPERLKKNEAFAEWRRTTPRPAPGDVQSH